MSFSLTAFDEALEHESLHAWLTGVRVLDLGDVLELDFDLRYGWVETEADSRGIAGRVGLRFRGVADWTLSAGFVDSVEVVDEHPALILLTDSVSRLSYQGEPADSDATLAALDLAHAQSIGSSAPTFLPTEGAFPKGWTTGTVAVGPTTLMQTYAHVLKQHGLEATLHPAPDPTAARPKPNLTACTVGTGYVIAQNPETYGELPPTSLD